MNELGFFEFQEQIMLNFLLIKLTQFEKIEGLEKNYFAGKREK